MRCSVGRLNPFWRSLWLSIPETTDPSQIGHQARSRYTAARVKDGKDSAATGPLVSLRQSRGLVNSSAKVQILHCPVLQHFHLHLHLQITSRLLLVEPRFLRPASAFWLPLRSASSMLLPFHRPVILLYVFRCACPVSPTGCLPLPLALSLPEDCLTFALPLSLPDPNPTDRRSTTPISSNTARYPASIFGRDF